jgi:uncharacterized protein YbjT (DUF2867 family)
MNILVTGANGFVGKALIERLTKEGHHITALVRDRKSIKSKDGIKWIEGDLLRPNSLPKIENIDKSYYLVHGLKGDEGQFEYEEAMAAVNFINWIRPTGSGIIYLGGLGPNEEKISPHLRSRHLTGAILGSSGLSTIEFRASIILGEGSLSFEMIKAISERFPIRPNFPLLNQPCQPLALKDLLNYLVQALELNDGHQIYEIGGPDALSYGELLDLYSHIAGLKRVKVKLPEVDAKILMRALDFAVPEHALIGKKLTESLEYPTVVSNNTSQIKFPDIQPMSSRDAMEEAFNASRTHYAPIWEKDFLKDLLSDKILAHSGLFSPELLQNLERVGKFKNILKRK